MKLSKFGSIGCFLFLMCLLDNIGALIQYDPLQSAENMISKVSLTQKGYIQFLRYISEVPPLTEYTFCIWIKSKNLTYSHPLLSYSKHEEERRIRVWVSPHGSTVNLEILNYPVFEIPVNFVENHWYHICQSWSSHQGAWNFYLNGKLKANGVAPKLKGVVIKENGDIVVGQEYTDFDKGLDDGIEGDIFGFNFVLSATSATVKHSTNSLESPSNYLRRRYELFGHKHNFHHHVPLNIHEVPVNYVPNIHKQRLPDPYKQEPFLNSLTTYAEDEIPGVLSYFSIEPNRKPKAFLDDIWNFFESEKRYHVRKPEYGSKIREVQRSKFSYSPHRVINDIHEANHKTLGLKLVELSYDCTLGKGAPLSGKGVLISWTKTPVRVFGGAILHNIPPFCTSL